MKIYKENKDYIPISHTIECYVEKRTNRISGDIGRKIKKLYIDEQKSIEVISTMLNKSEAAINKYLTKNKLL